MNKLLTYAAMTTFFLRFVEFSVFQTYNSALLGSIFPFDTPLLSPGGSVFGVYISVFDDGSFIFIWEFLKIWLSIL